MLNGTWLAFDVRCFKGLALDMGFSVPKMRIAVFVAEDWFFQSHFRKRAQALVDAGHELVVYTRLNNGSQPEDAAITFRDFSTMRSSVRVSDLFREAKALRFYIKQDSIDIVYAIGNRNILSSFLAFGGTSQKVINAPVGMGYLASQENWMDSFKKWPIKFLISRSFRRRQTLNIFENEDDLHDFFPADAQLGQKNFLIEGSGINPEDFVGPSRFLSPASRDKINVLLAARIVREKGVFEYLDAAKRLAAGSHELQFKLAGPIDRENYGTLNEDEVKAQCQLAGVTWAGEIEDMGKALAEADIFCLPSYREGLSRVLLEAAASCCAIVTTDVPGCRQVVTHEETGLIVPAKNSEALAGAIRRLSSNKVLREKVGQAAYQACLSRFHEKTVIAKTLDVFERISVADGVLSC